MTWYGPFVCESAIFRTYLATSGLVISGLILSGITITLLASIRRRKLSRLPQIYNKTSYNKNLSTVLNNRVEQPLFEQNPTKPLSTKMRGWEVDKIDVYIEGFT